MATRIVGFANQDRRRDRRREIVTDATLDEQDITIHDIGLSGFGAVGAGLRRDGTTWLELDARGELKFTDFKERKVMLLVNITYVDGNTGRFGGSFIELSGNAFDVIQDLMLDRDLRLVEF